MNEAEDEDREESVGFEFLSENVLKRDVNDSGGNQHFDPSHAGWRDGWYDITDAESEGDSVAEGEDQRLAEQWPPSETEETQSCDEEDVIPPQRDDMAVAVVEEAQEGLLGSGRCGLGSPEGERFSRVGGDDPIGAHAFVAEGEVWVVALTDADL